MENNANSVVDTVVNVDNTNSQEINKGTQENENSTNATIENVVQTVDYKKKFSESSSEAQRLFKENEELKKSLMLKDNVHENVQNTDSFYPGFEDLDEDAKNNLIAYTNTVTNKAKEELYKDPAIAFARTQYNEQIWESAFNQTVSKYPDLANSKDEFKSRYFNPNNVPQNINSILEDVAKIHLFDKAKEIGVKEAEEKKNLDDIERATSGENKSTVTRSLGDWQRMAQDNPGKFASLSKEYQSDLASGKI